MNFLYKASSSKNESFMTKFIKETRKKLKIMGVESLETFSNEINPFIEIVFHSISNIVELFFYFT